MTDFWGGFMYMFVFVYLLRKGGMRLVLLASFWIKGFLKFGIHWDYLSVSWQGGEWELLGGVMVW